jgi:hypothetical protein
MFTYDPSKVKITYAWESTPDGRVRPEHEALNGAEDPVVLEYVASLKARITEAVNNARKIPWTNDPIRLMSAFCRSFFEGEISDDPAWLDNAIEKYQHDKWEIESFYMGGGDA